VIRSAKRTLKAQSLTPKAEKKSGPGLQKKRESPSHERLAEVKDIDRDEAYEGEHGCEQEDEYQIW
jgi:hypothetical protein